jgi:hypothetical protein
MKNLGSFLYFAYGSNLSSDRIKISNPSAEPVGAALLQNYALDFDYLSKVMHNLDMMAPYSWNHL